MLTKSIGTVRAGFPPSFRFVTEAIKELIKRRSRFPSNPIPTNGSADADAQVENRIVTDRISNRSLYWHFKKFFVIHIVHYFDECQGIFF